MKPWNALLETLQVLNNRVVLPPLESTDITIEYSPSSLGVLASTGKVLLFTFGVTRPAGKLEAHATTASGFHGSCSCLLNTLGIAFPLCAELPLLNIV